jgi:hypothetical protein
VPCDDAINLSIGLDWNNGRLSLLGRAPNVEKWTTVEVPGAKGTGKEVGRAEP